jgi:hypothetical protein
VGIESNIKAIADWNMTRNNLILARGLEESMLEEEFNEFVVAETIEDMVDAYADFTYVLEGSRVKYLTCGVPLPEMIAWWERVEDWSSQCNSYMFQVILEHCFKTWGMDEDQVEHLMSDVLHVVIEANKAKAGEKDANGKVLKGEKWVNPSLTITEVINAHTTEYVKKKAH